MSVVTAIIGTQPAASRENPDGLRWARLKTDFIFAVLPPVENAGYGRRFCVWRAGDIRLGALIQTITGPCDAISGS
jgi:hypothetical protein